MRTLLLMRGAPGCGKSTYIKRNGLQPYTLSADDIRLLCQSPQQDVYGNAIISQKNEKIVWEILFNILKTRMEMGEFTVIDATNSKTEEMNRYKVLASEYRYRIYLIDFTDVPIEECKRRNAQREHLKVVPDAVIDKMYARFHTQKVPGQITVLKPDQLGKIWFRPIDLSKYEKIVHIGDIHGCNTALNKYFEKDPFNDHYFYIFTGDYLDRGIENAEVANTLFRMASLPNVLFLEGNHEKYLWAYGNSEVSKSREFELRTKRDLQKAGIPLEEFRKFYRRVGQCAWYNYHGKEVFACHGGIPILPSNPTLMATSQMVKGVGEYEDHAKIADVWMDMMPDNAYQIHGHRNTFEDPVQARERVFNLEGRVEYGGCLRVVELSEKGFETKEIPNDVYRKTTFDDVSMENIKVADLVLAMRKDTGCVVEKNFGHISSFNFTREVFAKKKLWDSMRVKARGLYIDIDKMKVAARSYNKFFNVGEMPFTEMSTLQNTLKFPVQVFIKENGFLVLVSYDEYGDYEDNLLVTTKSAITGEYSVWARNILNSILSKDKRAELSQYCKEKDCTLVFECIDIENDPHIIEYDQSQLYLLAEIRNDLEFSQVDYPSLVAVGRRFGLQVKTKTCTLDSWSDFYQWYLLVTEGHGIEFDRYIEGYVVEDSAGFMVKIKTKYYNFWKHMRTVANKTLKYGYITQTSQLHDSLSNEFYGFCKNLYESCDDKEKRRALATRDIISLRNDFLNSRSEKQ